MKLNKWLFGAAALALMASCSDNLDGPKAPSPAEEGGQGYIGINIQLPTVSGTRANDGFEDGEICEYVVKDAALLLFQGATEADAKFTGAFTLNEADPADVEMGQVTRRSIRVANVTGVSFAEDNNLYALVMCNGVVNGLYDLDDPDADWMWTDVTDTDGNKIGKTIREFQETILNLTTLKDNNSKLFSQDKDGTDYASYIFMTNSPLSEKKGGTSASGNPSIDSALPVLVNLDPTVYPTQSEAIANPAGVIHVERIVGKVTCSNFNKATELKVTVNGYDYELEVDQIWWDMAQNMADTYIVRNTNRNPIGTNPSATNYMWRWNYAAAAVDATSDNYYRMLGYTVLPVKQKGKDDNGNDIYKEYYRPYFCQVPGYNVPLTDNPKKPSTNYEKKNFVKEAMEFDPTNEPVKWAMNEKTNAENKVAFEGPGAFYPLENTFPVNYMKYANTTRVGFWVTFNFKPVANAAGETGAPLDMENTNFYINGMDKTTLYLDDENGNDPLVNLAIADLSKSANHPDLWKAIDDILVKGDNGGKIENVKISDLITITSSSDQSGKVVITEVKFKDFSTLPAKYEGYFIEGETPKYIFNSTRLTALNNLGTYYKYEGGRSFYEVRIKHFGDDNTPWDGDSKTSATTIDESYGPAGTRSINYLGRYGIVRNNWYDLNVKVIKTLGYPTDPELWDSSWPGKPDDNKDQYIAVELKVLSWAKRSQDVEF